MHVASELGLTPALSSAVHDYCIEHSTPLAPEVTEHRQKSLEFCEQSPDSSGARPVLMISSLQAQFLSFLTLLLRPTHILEIGAFTGYSALAFSHTTSPPPKILTLDIPSSPALPFATTTLSPYPNISYSATCPALEHLQSLPADTEPFDLIFIDADKGGYVKYLELILTRGLLAKRGLVVADNALFHGLVAGEVGWESRRGTLMEKGGKDSDVEKELEREGRNAQGIDRFNKWVREDGRLESVVLPMFDGISLIQLKD